jgi:hypothetical protein
MSENPGGYNIFRFSGPFFLKTKLPEKKEFIRLDRI